MTAHTRIVVTLLVFLALAGVRSAAAQTAPAQPAPTAAGDSQSSPLVVEPIEEGWVLAPDARAADLGGKVGSLIGGYGGRITDRTWLIGAGGYWLTNRDDDFKLAYAGAVFEWLALKDHPIGFGVRTLVGGGSATLPITLGTDGRGRDDIRFGSRRAFPVDAPRRFAVRDDFFIAEPQVNLLWNVTPRYRLSVGVGYRLIGAAPILSDDLEGVSGSVSFQIGGK